MNAHHIYVLVAMLICFGMALSQFFYAKDPASGHAYIAALIVVVALL